MKSTSPQKIFSQGRIETSSMLFRCALLTAFLSLPVTMHANEENLLVNGDFEQVDQITPEEKERRNIGQWVLGNTPELLPSQWALHEAHAGTITMVSDDVRSGLYALKVQSGWVYNGFRCPPEPLLKISFKAKGTGRVRVMLFQYEKGLDGAVLQFLPTAEVKTIELIDEWKEYTFEHQVDQPDANDIALALDVAETMLVDDIVVSIP
jgi:hypothetical protein